MLCWNEIEPKINRNKITFKFCYNKRQREIKFRT